MSLVNIFYCNNGSLATKRIFVNCTTTTETLKKIFDLEIFEKSNIYYLVLIVAYSNNKHVYYLQTKKGLKSLLKNDEESYIFQVYVVKCNDSFESILDLLFCPTTRRQLEKVLRKANRSRILVSFSATGVFSSFDVDVRNFPKKSAQEQDEDDRIVNLLEETSDNQSLMMKELESIFNNIVCIEDQQTKMLDNQIRLDDLTKTVLDFTDQMSSEFDKLSILSSKRFSDLTDKVYDLSEITEDLDNVLYDTYGQLERRVQSLVEETQISSEKYIENLKDQIGKQNEEIKGLILETYPPTEPSISYQSIRSEDFIEISDDDETASVYFQQNNRN